MFVPVGRVSIDVDLATTTKAYSNPSSLAVCHEVGLDVFARLLIRYKAYITNEHYDAAELARRLLGLVPVALLVASAATER